MRVGYAGNYGAALFVDETAPTDADWAWAALSPDPLTEPPTIYYDPHAVTVFPPATVMPLNRLRDVILEWVNTAQRPMSVDWMPVNGLVCELTEDGGLLHNSARRPVMNSRSASLSVSSRAAR